ncbi:MAG TPA: tetratricopeptide repeat protein [Balneolaceae bacterium]|nr:tetratricopeptide repeat protein [Balneolaceae bacterium]
MFLVLGCGQSLKSSWSNFRAYYNTYYNAKKNFNAGLKKVEEQPYKIDPNQPVRIHHAPLPAGDSDFEKAIDKGAKVLRKYPNSKWVDESLLLIGKSYYYQQKFYPALQKFEELQKIGTSPKMKQLAVIWKGRTLLDLKKYNQGVTYLGEILEDYPQNWSVRQKGQIQALMGEHHAMLQNWEQASNYLSKAISNIDKKKIMGRTLFLYGQVLEHQERYGEAYYAFSKVKDYFPGFEYIYWAGVKQADVARREGNLDVAISIYDKLRKDDKNFQRRDELTYQIARTLEMKGSNKAAEQSYRLLLYGTQDQATQSRSLKSDIYYRLGKINSDVYNNYDLAAAYFDSSSMMKSNVSDNEDTRNAQALAKAFNTYTRLRKNIQHADSLLWLGSLSSGQLDSVIQKIRLQKRNELMNRQEEDAQNTLANENFQESGQPTKSSIYGFLNYRSPELVQRAKEEFRIIWGNRPLVDDWRRQEAIQQISVDTEQVSTQDTTAQITTADQADIAGLDLNLDEIPKTESDRIRLKTQKANAQYQLGNLFFLNLSAPDSARRYFYRVIHEDLDHELRARSMYSLYELFNTTGRKDSLRYWGNRILKEYPKTKYARRVRSNLGESSPQTADEDSSRILLEKYRYIEHSKDPYKAAKLRKLALENRDSDLASYIYYQAIESYIRQARARQNVADSLQKKIYGFLSDSLKKPTVSRDSTQYISVDSLHFSHMYWDSVRIVLQEFDTTFTNSRQHQKVRKLLETLGKPKAHTQAKLPTCEDLGASLSVSPGMQEFLSKVTYPEKLKNMSLSGKVEYSFVVSPDGNWDSYRLVSNRTSLGIEDAFEKAFKKHLHFKPLDIKNPPKKLRCKVSFPISQ